MRWIYISPHLDDAVLSAGGLIYEQTKAGMPVEIWTIVCGFPNPGELTPYAQALHYQWGTSGAEETVSLRREEDRQAAAIVGAKPVHFDVPDCIYRRGSKGEPLYMDIFVPPHPVEANLSDQIALEISTRLQPDDLVVCQLGIGGHVDHMIVRRAAERLGRSLRYLADIPYLFNQPADLRSITNGSKPDVFPITEAGLKSWVEAILAYESQFSSLFENPEKMEAAIRNFILEWKGLPVWKVA